MDKALISLTFDDGLRCQFEKALPILDQYGFPATFFLVANTEPIFKDGTKETDEFNWRKIAWNADDIRLLKGMIYRGHEIGSHSVTHKEEEMKKCPEKEARDSKRFIDGSVGREEVSSFCYPFYRSHAYLVDAVKNAGYEQARGGGMAPDYVPKNNSYYTVPHDSSLHRFNVDCRQISKNEDVGKWVQPGRWHILTFHGIGGKQDGWEPICVEQFATQMEELAKLRDSAAVEVVTFKDGAGRFREPTLR